MSKVSNMLSLFEPKKNDQEKKAPIHTDKIKPASSNSTFSGNIMKVQLITLVWSSLKNFSNVQKYHHVLI